MIGAVLSEEKVVEIGVAQFPGVHQNSPQLDVCEVESIFPDVTILDVSVLLNLEIIWNGGEITFVEAEDAPNRIGDSRIRRDLGGIIDGVGEDARLFRLALLVNPKQC